MYCLLHETLAFRELNKDTVRMLLGNEGKDNMPSYKVPSRFKSEYVYRF